VKIGQLTPAQLNQQFGGAGLRVRIGPFVFRLHTPISSFIADFSFAYADFPVCESEVSDFRIQLAPAPRWRPWREAQARFWADGANPFQTFPRRVAMPWAEWGLNWCIYNHAHQFLIFHSAVVEKSGRAAILAGPSGSGKSTLCAALLGHGWRLLSDEFALLDPASGYLLPIPKPVGLKGESIGLIEKLLPHSRIGRVFAPTRKGRIAHLYPPSEAVANTELVPVRKAGGFLRLETNCFNYEALGRAAFEALGTLVEGTQCYELPFAEVAAAAELVDNLAEFQPAASLPVDAA
jgi:HprK-related kinase A